MDEVGGKLIYLSITRPNVSYAVGIVSQFMQNPHTNHCNVFHTIRLLYEDKGNIQIIGYYDTDWADCSIDRRFTKGCFVLIGGCIVSPKGKKQIVAIWSSAEVEYKSMTLITCELM